MKEFSYAAIEAATKSFSAEHLVGKGSHGSVFKATLNDGQIVAVKKPSDDDAAAAAKLRNEIAILARIKHPGIVGLLGFARSPTTELLVMEFLPNGSLHDLLHRSPTTPPWPRRAAAALQLARAVLALHQAAPAGIVHRDIKSTNVLLDAEWNAKLADFGLAAAGERPTAAAGTIGYLDPACAESGESADVFSFGVLLLELVSSRKVVDVARDVARDPALLVAWAAPRIRTGDLAAVCDGGVAPVQAGMRRVLRVAARCVEEEVAMRPLMTELVVELQRVVEGGLRRRVLGKGVHLHEWFKIWRWWEEKKVAAMARTNSCGDDGDHRELELELHFFARNDEVDLH